MDQNSKPTNDLNENKNTLSASSFPASVPSSSPAPSPALSPTVPVATNVFPSPSAPAPAKSNLPPILPVSPVSDSIPEPAINMNSEQNSQKFKLATNEVQGPKPPLVGGGGSKLAMIAIALIFLVIVGIGGYYFYSKDNISQPASTPDVVPVKTIPIVDMNLDSDKDGLPDAIEKVLGTYMTKADTDDDGYTDLQEIKSGYNPLIAGAAGKYSPEEWDNVKGKIKIEDRGFYEREFGAPIAPVQSPISSPALSSTPSQSPNVSPVVSIKCEFPDKIGDYTKQVVNNIPIDGPSAPKGVLNGKLISYSGLNIISILTFDNIENTGNYYSNGTKEGFVGCEISGIKGECRFKNTDNGQGGVNIEGNFSWFENKTVKIITTLIQGGLNKNIVELENKAKENLNLFVVQIKNCQAE